MRPNLSFEHLATALAVLGTSVLVGCGGAEPVAQTPVQSVEVAPPPAAPAAVSVGVAAPAAPVVAAPAAPAMPALGVAASGTGTAVATPATPAVAVTMKPKAPATPAKKGANAQASCGAGTCSASK